MTRQRQVSIDGRVTYFRWDEPHAVYRIFNHDGRLIYIGASYDPEARIKVHRREQAWGHEIASHTEVWYPTRREALAAEHRGGKPGLQRRRNTPWAPSQPGPHVRRQGGRNPQGPP